MKNNDHQDQKTLKSGFKYRHGRKKLLVVSLSLYCSYQPLTYKKRSRAQIAKYERIINKLEIKINERLGNDIVIALDSTGIKVANRGEWIRHKWHVRKGSLKIHVAVDIKKRKRILSLKRKRILKIKSSVRNLNLNNDDDKKPITLIVDASGLHYSNVLL